MYGHFWCIYHFNYSSYFVKASSIYLVLSYLFIYYCCSLQVNYLFIYYCCSLQLSNLFIYLLIIVARYKWNIYLFILLFFSLLTARSLLKLISIHKRSPLYTHTQGDICTASCAYFACTQAHAFARTHTHVYALFKETSNALLHSYELRNDVVVVNAVSFFKCWNCFFLFDCFLWSTIKLCSLL